MSFSYSWQLRKEHHFWCSYKCLRPFLFCERFNNAVRWVCPWSILFLLNLKSWKLLLWSRWRNKVLKMLYQSGRVISNFWCNKKHCLRRSIFGLKYSPCKPMLYYSVMDFFLVLQVMQEIWNFVLRLARHRKWKKSPTILTLHALLRDVCQLTWKK